jgi:hypothetical protein
MRYTAVFTLKSNIFTRLLFPFVLLAVMSCQFIIEKIFGWLDGATIILIHELLAKVRPWMAAVCGMVFSFVLMAISAKISERIFRKKEI